MAEEKRIDETDVRIIECLHENSRMTMKELGGKVHLTGQAVRNRVERLESLGILERYTVNVNCPVFGYRIHALIRARMTRTEQAAFLALCTPSCSRLVHCYAVTGAHNIFFDIYFKEMDAMQAVLDKVGEHCNIEVQIVLQENGR